MSQPASAQAVGKGISNLELPRFVSLKAREANLRVGPGKNYGVQWRYLRKGLPLEVIQEFDYWRRVRDSEGNEGWVFHSLLSGKRTAIIAPWDKAKQNSFIVVRARPNDEARPVRKFAAGVLVSVESCTGEWCEVEHRKGEGWVKKADIWGVYPDEDIKD